MADGCRYNHIVEKVIVLLLPLKTKRHVSTNWYFCDDWHTHSPGTPNLPYKLIDHCIERWSLCLDAVPFLHSQKSLWWRHNGHDGVSNLQPHHYLLNRLFGCRSQKTSNSALLAFVRGIHRGTMNSPHKWPVTRKMFPFHDVIMSKSEITVELCCICGLQIGNTQSVPCSNQYPIAHQSLL